MQTGLKIIQITRELIELKRVELTAKRELRNHKKSSYDEIDIQEKQMKVTEDVIEVVEVKEAKGKMTVNNVQELLWDEIYKLRNEETTAANLSAITNATGKIMSAEVLKIKYAELTGQKPKSMMLENKSE